MSTDSQQEVAAELKIQHGGLIEFEAGLSKVDGERSHSSCGQSDFQHRLESDVSEDRE